MLKKSLTIFLLFISLTSFAGEKLEVTVKGMVCSFCSQGITKKFKEQPTVKDVNVSLENHLVTIDLKDDQKLEDKSIYSILGDAGYAVEKIARK